MKIGRLIANVTAGKVAAVAGTVAMDAVWYARYRRGGGQQPPLTWEFDGVSDWNDVSAPGQVGLKVLHSVMGKRPPASWAGPTQNYVHWFTGVGWGAAYGLVAGRGPRRWWLAGPLLGVAAWGTSYVVLPPLGVYKPIWEYDGRTLAQDLSAHVVYGTVTAAAYRTLRPRRRRN